MPKGNQAIREEFHKNKIGHGDVLFFFSHALAQFSDLTQDA